MTQPLNQNKMKQTAVEWLIEQMMYQMGIRIENTTIGCELFEQAKAMHKQEIIHSYRCGAAEVGMVAVNKPEQYYNETFGGNNEHE